jgi:hypothetical protein
MHKLCGPPVPKLGPFGDAATFQTDPMTVEYERQEAESAKLDAEILAERKKKKKKRCLEADRSQPSRAACV